LLNNQTISTLNIALKYFVTFWWLDIKKRR